MPKRECGLSVTITQVETNDDIYTVATLAQEIWTQHFTPIIGASQVDYMLNKFQSTEAITAQIADGWEYNQEDILAKAKEQVISSEEIIMKYVPAYH